MTPRQPIGYDISNTSGTNTKTGDSITFEELMQNISQEFNTFHKVENNLVKELKDIKDMETNLKNIAIQIESMQKLMSAREEMFRQLVNERNKGRTMNINLCERFIERISRLNYELGLSITRVKSELSKLFIEEKDLIYLESENTREAMNEISNKAKKLNTEVILISNYHAVFDNHISQISQEITLIAEERKRDFNRPKPVKGFGG